MITSRVPFPLEKGDKLRIYHQLKYLSQRHRIILVSICRNDREIEAGRNELTKFCSEIHFFKIPRWRRLLGLPIGLLRREPFSVRYFYSSSIAKQIVELIFRKDPDHIYCQLIRVANYVRKLPYPKTIDYMDAFSLGFQRRAEQSGVFSKPFYRLEAKLLRSFESEVYKDFNKHCIISKQDRDHLDILSREKIEVIPNGVDTDFFHPNPEFKKSYDLVFCGNMGYDPNIKAAEFISEIAEGLSRKLPDLKILIAGARPHPSIRELNGQNGITVSGWLDDIREAYWGGKVNIAPIFTGSGLQNKILEAMACGTPCITSSIVNKSIGAENGKHLLIASDRGEFIEQITFLLKDNNKQKDLAANALTFVKESYDWDAYSAKLNELLNDY